MESHEYVELVTGQMRCKKARGMVAEELQNHIDDQVEKYIEFGMEKDKAEEEAVRKMGDPIEVGTDMDRIHRPKMDYKVLAMVAVFSFLGILVQIVTIVSTKNLRGTITENITNILGYFAIGLIVMTVMMFIDYSILGKYLLPIYVGLMLVLLLSSEIIDAGVFLTSDFTRALFLLLTPIYAAFVYSQRNAGYKGIVLSVLLLGFTALLYLRSYTYNTFDSIDLFFVGIIVLSFAVIKGWFLVNRKWTVLTLWLMWIVPLATLVIGILTGIIGRVYQKDRLLAFFHPADYAQGAGYQTVYMRNMLGELKLFGPCADLSDISLFGGSSAFDFGYILCRFGVIGGILLVAGIGLLIVLMLDRILKQSNRLGTLVGLSCILALLLPAVRNILVSLTAFPATNAVLPFFTVSGKGTIGVYMLLGVFLSVYRNSNIVSEKSMKTKFKIVMEKNQ